MMVNVHNVHWQISELANVQADKCLSLQCPFWQIFKLENNQVCKSQCWKMSKFANDLLANVHISKCPSCQMSKIAYPSWQMSKLGNVQVGKCPYWQMSKLGNNRVDKCPCWQKSRLSNFQVGKCPNW